VGADHRQGAEDQRNQRSEDEGEMAEFGNHGQLPRLCGLGRGRRYVLVGVMPAWHR
jgi:hypothetical protein